MASDVDICNLALARLGDEATVSSLDPPEESAQAYHCARFYPIARDTLLEAHDWSFATTRRALAELSDATPPAGWLYAYSRPTGAVRLLACLEAEAPDDSDPQPFTTEALTDGTRVIYSNTQDAVMRYTIRVIDPAVFPPLFVDALSLLLASHLAGPLLKGTAGVQMSRAMGSAFAGVLAMAKTSDANQRRQDTTHTPAWIAGR